MPSDDAQALRELLDTAAELMVEATPDGRLTYVNRAWRRTFGYTAEEASALRVVDLIAPEDAGRYRRLARRLLSGETIESFEAVLVAKDGRRAACRGRAVPVMADDPDAPNGRRCVATRSAFRDVTADRRADALRSWLAKTLESTPDFVGVGGHDGRIVYLNDAGRRMVGIAPDDDLSTILAPQLHPPETIALFFREAFPAVERGETWMGEGELLSLGGERIPVSIVIVPHPALGADEPPRFTAVMRDLRERKRAEAELADSTRELRSLLDARRRAEEALGASEAWHRALLDALPLAVYIAVPGPTAPADYVSLGIEALGYSRDEWMREGDLWRRVLHPEDRERVIREVDAASAERRARTSEYRVVTRDGDVRWVHDRAELVTSADGRTVWRGVLLDVTERRRLEEQLRQAQKMEALGQFAGAVAHDFNNMLMVMRGNADTVLAGLGDTPDDAAARDALEDIVAAADRASVLTRQILAFSRRQVLQPTRVELAGAVPAVMRLLEQAVGPQVRVETRLDPQATTIRADATQITQVLLNLAVNARDAMPRGGTLVIETGTTTLEQPLTHAHGVVPAGRWGVLTVRDDGIGMDAATLARIFEPFFTTKPRGRGTGLGLSTVYGIVRQSGGHVAVTSRPGEGTTFRLFFPCLTADAAGPARETARRPALASGRRVLVVDDEPAVYRATRRMLEREGYVVEVAADGAAALAALVAAAGRGELPDVVLTDVQMPGLSGRELGHRIAAAFGALPVVYMSGYTTDDVLYRQLVRDGQRIVAKPFTRETLVAAISEAAVRPNA